MTTAQDRDCYCGELATVDRPCDVCRKASDDDKSKDAPKMTKEQIAVASYEMFMGAMSMLQTRLDRTASKNYISINLEGLISPFDRMQMHFVRPGGKAPLEVIDDVRGIAVVCLELLDDVADGYDVDAREEGIHKGDGQKLRETVAALRAKLPPAPWRG